MVKKNGKAVQGVNSSNRSISQFSKYAQRLFKQWQ